MSRRTTPHDAARPYATIREAAARLGVGERVLRGAVARGEVPLYRAPSAWPRVAVAEVEAWLRAHRAEPVHPTPHAGARVAEVLARGDRQP